MIREDKKVIGQKVLLLIFALLFFAMLAIGLLYLSTTSQIESPEIKDNIHKDIAKSRIEDFSNCANLKAYDSLYNVTKHKIILYKAEGYVKEDWIKELKRKFVDESETAFNTLCKYLICSTTPDSRTYKYIIKIFDEKIKPTRKEFFKSTNYSALPDVEGIVSRYKETCELIKKNNNIYVNCQYTSKEDAANKISKANSLIADQYIKNCRFLIEELNKVGAQIEKSHRHKINNQLEEFNNCLYSNYVRYNSLSLSISGLIADYESLFSGKSYKGTNDINELKQRFNSLIKDKADRHYRYVESCVEQLRGYRTMTESYFDELVRNANNEIEGYKTRKSTTYGMAAKNCDNLQTTLDIYKKNADTHYHPIITHIVKRVDNIRPNGQWMFMNLDGNNRIYESISNYHKNNRTSTMSFNISGYSEFVFEIKNDSEQNYDYVVVGVNQYPTHSSMYNAKGYNGWKRIRLKNLDRTKSYTIYVTYSKDGSNHHGKDRGYVKIPQNN